MLPLEKKSWYSSSKTGKVDFIVRYMTDDKKDIF